LPAAWPVAADPFCGQRGGAEPADGSRSGGASLADALPADAPQALARDAALDAPLTPAGSGVPPPPDDTPPPAYSWASAPDGAEPSAPVAASPAATDEALTAVAAPSARPAACAGLRRAHRAAR
jgi:hypothetical protein